MSKKNIPLIIFLIIIFYCLNHSAISQNSDSLLLELKKDKHDTTKVDLLIELSLKLRYSDPDSALQLANQALSISENINFNKGKIESYQNIGIYHLFKSNYVSSLEFFQKALNIATNQKDYKKISTITNNIGIVYFQIGAYPKALEYYQKCLEISDSLGDEKTAGSAINNIGLIHKNMRNSVLAKEYFYKALKYKEKEKDSFAIASIYNNLGVLYLVNKEDSLAIVSFKNAMPFFETTNNKFGIASVYNNLGIANFNRGNYKFANEYHFKSLQIKKEINDLKGTSSTYNNLAFVKLNLAKSELNWHNSIKLYKEARDYAIKSITIAKKVNALSELKNAYEHLSNAYYGLEDYKKAFYFKDKYHILNDSLYNINKENEIGKMEALYQSEKKDLQIKNLEKENELKNTQLEKMKIRQLLSYLIIFVSFYIIVSLILIRKRLKKKNKTISYQKETITSQYEEILSQNEEIVSQKEELETHRNHLEKLVEKRTADLKLAKEKAEESDRLKTAFLSNMSHEIRTPMNAIVGFTSLLSDTELTDETKEELINHINNNTDTLLKLIDDILDIAKIESGQLKINYKEFSIHQALDALIPIYDEKKRILNKKDIKFKVTQYKKDIVVKSDPLRLQQILINLIDNAFKFTEKGEVEVGFDIKQADNMNNVIFFVIDTGIGMSEEQMGVIFKRFSKIEDNKVKFYRGAGLGLTISKNIVELLGGNLSVESEIGKGSKFQFTLPLSK